jgi:hypothetical protein
MPRPVIIVLAAFAAMAILPQVLIAVDSQQSTDDPAPAAARVIDELRGTYRGVGLRDTAADIRRVFGPSEFAGAATPLAPLDADPDHMDVGGPMVVTQPRLKPKSGTEPETKLRYPGVSFLLWKDRVFLMMITKEGAATQRGLAIGHELEGADDLYQYLNCDEAGFIDDDVDFFESEETFPFCAGALRPRRHIWFGQDPIASITIATTSFDGYECPTQRREERPRRAPAPFLQCP